jgi:hypothetical protein
MATQGDWGVRFLPVSPPLATRAKALAADGPPMWHDFMEELREIYLDMVRATGRHRCWPRWMHHAAAPSGARRRSACGAHDALGDRAGDRTGIA